MPSPTAPVTADYSEGVAPRMTTTRELMELGRENWHFILFFNLPLLAQLLMPLGHHCRLATSRGLR